MQKSVKKPRFNERLDRKLKNYAVRTLEDFDKTIAADSEVKKTLYAQIKNISSTLRGGQYLVFSVESRLNDATKIKSGLETYLESQAQAGKLGADQIQKIRTYADGLTGVVENHIQDTEAKRIARQLTAAKNLQYYDDVTTRATAALEQHYEGVKDRKYLDSFTDHVRGMAKVMKGEATTDGKKKIRNYADRLTYLKKRVKTLMGTIDAGYENKILSADQAREMTHQTMKLITDYSNAAYFKRKRNSIKEDSSAKTHDMFMYDMVKHIAGKRNYFRDEIATTKAQEAAEEAERARAAEKARLHQVRVSKIFREVRNIRLDNLANASKRAAEKYAREYTTNIAEQYAGFRGKMRYFGERVADLFNRYVEPKLANFSSNVF